MERLYLDKLRNPDGKLSRRTSTIINLILITLFTKISNNGASDFFPKSQINSPASNKITNKGLEYAQSPTAFLNSRQNLKTKPDPYANNNAAYIPQNSAKGVKTGNLIGKDAPIYKHQPIQNGIDLIRRPQNPKVSRTPVISPAGLDTNFHNTNKLQNNINSNDLFNNKISNANQYPNDQKVSQNNPLFLGTAIKSTGIENSQNKLNFNLLNNKGLGTRNQFGVNDNNINARNDIYPQHRLYDNDVNKVAENFNLNTPVLQQGFYIPTTYKGTPKNKQPFVSDESFKTVPNPQSDKRIALNSYVPTNNFVNPSNFMIPAEDKYDMIGRIFGGYKTSKFPGNEKSFPTNDNKMKADKINNKFNEFKQNSPNDLKKGYVNKAFENKIYFSPNQRRFNDDTLSFQDDLFFNPTSSPTGFPGRADRSIFGTKASTPTPLFADFSNNDALSVGGFRSKNLLGDDSFGVSDYDRNRQTIDGDLFSPTPASQIRNNRFGFGDFQELGGTSRGSGKSFDYSYDNNNDNRFLGDTSGVAKNLNVNTYNPSTKEQNFSDGFSKTSGHSDAKVYKDGDEYNKSFGYSDSGSGSDYKTFDDSNQNGFKKSHENRNDRSDAKSYGSADGYKRTFYDGNNYDVSDGYTDNVQYVKNGDKGGHSQHYDNKGTTGAQATNGYRKGVAKVASVLRNGVKGVVPPYKDIPNSLTSDLPNQANYKPFDVNETPDIHNKLPI